MKTITATVPAWLPAHAEAGLMQKTDIDAITVLSFVKHDMSGSGWVKVGTADITVRLIDEASFTKSQIDTLKNARNTLLAEAQKKCNYIDNQISKLSALTMRVPADSEPEAV